MARSGNLHSLSGLAGSRLGPYQVRDGLPLNCSTPTVVPQAAPTVRGSTNRTNGVVVVVVVGGTEVVVESGNTVDDVEVVVSTTAAGSAPDDPTMKRPTSTEIPARVTTASAAVRRIGAVYARASPCQVF